MILPRPRMSHVLLLYSLQGLVLLVVGINEFFRYYERISFITYEEFLQTPENIQRESSAAWIRRNQRNDAVQINFNAFSREWDIFVQYDEHFCKDNAAVEIHNNAGEVFVTTVSEMGITAYKGIVRISPFGAVVGVVTGSIDDGIFRGEIKLHNDSFYIEPAKKYCTVNCWYNAIIYRASDVLLGNIFGRMCSEQNETECVRDTVDVHPGNKSGLWRHLDTGNLPTKGNSSARHSSHKLIRVGRQSSRRNPNRERTCMMMAVSDHHFTRAYGRNNAIAQMKRYMEAADRVFRNSDFNRDGRSDRIGLKAARFQVYENSNHPMAKYGSNCRQIIAAFGTLKFQDYCLGIMFSRQTWTPKATIGLAYVGSGSSSFGPASGICSKRTVYFSQDDRTLMTQNVLIVTEMDQRGRVLPDLVNAMTVAHEIGHSFGSYHDSTRNPICMPGTFTRGGNYLMSPTADDGKRPNNNRFSPCSLDLINPVIDSNGGCFVEGIPSDEMPMATTRQVPRTPAVTALTTATTSTQSTFRPQIVFPGDGCGQMNMATCTCTDNPNCLLCCELGGECMTSDNLGILYHGPQGSEPYKAPLGTTCTADGQFVCSVDGQCISKTEAEQTFNRESQQEPAKDQEKGGTINWIKEKWLYIFLSLLILLVVPGAVFGYLHHGKERKRVKSFSKSVSKAKQKVERQFPEYKQAKLQKEKSRDLLSRLIVLFPKAPVPLLKKVSERQKTEEEAVKYLVNRGHLLKKQR